MLNLTITLLVKSPRDYIVGRFDMDDDITWSFGAHRADWAAFLWTLLHAPREFMTVVVRGEELLNG